MPVLSPSAKNIVTGILFALLWSSASVAGKYGLLSAEPLVFFNARFILAGILLLIFAHIILKDRLPKKAEWKQLTIFGALNTTLYLGIYIIALQQVAAGISTLAVALNPLLISSMTSVVMKRKIKTSEWIGIFLGIIGVTIATYPLLKTSYATVSGMLLMALCMVIYSMGAVYYSSVTWALSRATINAWQIFIGGFLLLPFTILFYKGGNHFDFRFWASLFWLIIPVSIFAVQLWLRLLQQDAVSASLWLFLCPVFGLIYATWLLTEPFTVYTATGTLLVMVALYVGQKIK
ncbi:MAG: DMT family transporter [Bacteroidetes bacterium]|nr:DMT family transporter [Bacteroidota bacterium]MBS1541551.1 DMT family transporter [Bacteroidota bacterium]